MTARLASSIELTRRVFYRDQIGYIDIPRCGSTSIRSLLSSLDFKAKEFSERPELWLWTVVRHPFSRLISGVSGYANARLLLGGHADHEVILDVARHVAANFREGMYRPLSEHTVPQVEYISWKPDTVIKLDNIEKVSSLLAKHGFGPVEIPHLQAAEKDLKTAIAEILAPHYDQVVEYYRQDYDLWNSGL